MEDGDPDGFEECALVEVLVVDSWLVYIKPTVWLPASVFLVEEGVKNDGQGGVKDVVELVNVAVEKYHSWKKGKAPVDNDGGVVGIKKIGGANFTPTEDLFYQKQLLNTSFHLKDSKLVPATKTRGVFKFEVRSK